MGEENEISINLVSDTRPLDLIGNQNVSRDARDPLSSDSIRESAEAAPSNPAVFNAPAFNISDIPVQEAPPLPQFQFDSTPESNVLTDQVRSLVLDALKNVSINGVYPQVSGSSIDFSLDDTRTSAPEQWDYMNAAANQATSQQPQAQGPLPNNQQVDNQVQVFSVQGPTAQLAEEEVQKVHYSDKDIRAIINAAREAGILFQAPPQPPNQNNTQTNNQRGTDAATPNVDAPNAQTTQGVANNQAPQVQPNTSGATQNQPTRPADQNQQQQPSGARPVSDTNPSVANPDARPVRDRDSDTANPNAQPVRDRDSDTANPSARPLRDRDSDTANPNARPVGRDRENNASRLTPSISPVEASKEAVQTIPVLMRRSDLQEPMIAYIMGKGYENVNNTEDNILFKNLQGTQANYPSNEYWYPDVFPKMPDGLDVEKTYVLGVTIPVSSGDPQAPSAPILKWLPTGPCST